MMIAWRRRIVEGAAVLLGLALLPALPGEAAETTAAARNQESESRLRRDITFLASDACEGRGPGTQGIDKSADYIANEFKKAGLKPANPDGSYFQPFTINGATLQGTPRLVFKGPRGQVIELKQGVHFEPLGLGAAGKVADAPVVFAGYGISRAPEKPGEDDPSYDDYEGMDVEGKVVILLRDVPQASSKLGAKLKPQAPFTSKMGRAENRHARGALFVSPADNVREGDDLLDFSFTALSDDRGKLPGAHIKRSVLETLLQSQAANLGDLERAIETEFKPHSIELKGWTVSLDVPLTFGKIPLKNVAGVLEGAGPLAKQTVVIGAHYDHLGYGSANSLAKSRTRAIHHGADDNGSGTTTILELARRFGEMRGRQGRRLVFLTFSGEELGLLGSKHYCKHPFFPLQDTIAMVNLDMVGRMRADEKTKKDRLLVDGSNTSKTFGPMLDDLNKKHDFHLVKAETMPPNSDHFSFYKEKLPVLFFWTGLHADYHRPSDTAEKINVAGMRRVADLSEEVIALLATEEKRPAYVEVKVGGTSGARGNAPRLGIMPDYEYKGEGILLEGTSDGGPAAKAGLKAGDRIVQMAGKPVRNLQAYMQLMGTQKKGDTLELEILRADKKMTIKVKLE